MGNYDYLKFIWYAKFLLIVINIDFNFINPPFNHVVSTQNFNTIIKTRDYSLTQKHVQNVDFEINDWPYELVFLYMYLRFEFSVCYSFEWARKKRKYIKTLIYGLIYWNWMIQNKNDYEFDTSNCLKLERFNKKFLFGPGLIWTLLVKTKYFHPYLVFSFHCVCLSEWPVLALYRIQLHNTYQD